MTAVNKKIAISLAIILAVIAGWVVYKWSTFTLFDLEEKKVVEIPVEGKGYRLAVYYIPSNATSQSYIQVRKIESPRENVIANYERYNHVVSYRLIQNDTLELVLQDTTSFLGSKKPDTLHLGLD